MAEHITRDEYGRPIDKTITVDGRRAVGTTGAQILFGSVEGLETLCLEADASGACTFIVRSGAGAVWPGGTLTLAGAGSGIVNVPVASATFTVTFTSALGGVEGWCICYLRKGAAT